MHKFNNIKIAFYNNKTFKFCEIFIDFNLISMSS